MTMRTLTLAASLLFLATPALASAPPVAQPSPANATGRFWIAVIDRPGLKMLGRLDANGKAFDVVEFRAIEAGDPPAARVTGSGGAVAQPTVAATGDPYGFLPWINNLRARSGLGPVGHDPNLSVWAAVNNVHQASRGMGHHEMGPARRQNAGIGDFASVCQAWVASPAHMAAFLDPSLTWVGIAGNGAFWTFNGR